MSAALHDGFSPSPSTEDQEVARLPVSAITHEQIIGALGRVEGLIEAESIARQEFRSTFTTRLESIERRTGEVALELQKMQTRMDHPQQVGAVQSIVGMFERQPLLAVVISGLILALGSGGVISIWEAVAK